jgi:uncharacterized membrane protein
MWALLLSAVARLRILSTAQRIGVVVAFVFYVAAGALHFIKAAPYLRIMPPYIPWHVAMVRISGGLEILGGVGLLLPATRRAAAWGLVALLIAIFPANLYMAIHPAEAGATGIAPLFRWGRLPLQAVLIWWLLWCTRPRYTSLTPAVAAIGIVIFRRKPPERRWIARLLDWRASATSMMRL